ncbi:transcriptional regulator [Pseudomonas protegens]|uniref:helix-turn-helix domain-containing protein n=1 Tax=Pseudomonas protegens TaxID=380021 RepID=UPI000807176B|nr:helix-turn-helix transcriptional regulator [Pseudomonas protegens]RBJ81306.1 XRE family transcriptional regulator [Pseudomonas sp. MWU12-2534b]OBZ19675.1 transcriptional regulator [Pseudomonas protegens]OBZ22474.1 transcriptional regulator [Pseudomonas protegens]OKK41291.1 transcriptional regulator [Pseudomonas protegens]OKK43364.1 transcriptional regulator [Pseudomonas protegens]
MLIAEGVGSRLREERERLGLSQSDFGALVGVSRGTQKNYEVGTAVGAMDLKYVAALETADVDATYVLTGSRSIGAGLSRIESQIIDQYRRIPEEDQRALRRFLKAMFDDADQ